ncbi:MAG: metallophosphoesterase [Beijerinckiaceae bacterium]
MISRRTFLKWAAGLFALGASTSAYGVFVEPLYRLRVTRYQVTPRGWPAGFKLKLALVADIHACLPWMDDKRIGRIAEATNALGCDAIVLLGDYVATHRFQTQQPPDVWAAALMKLKAPLGVHAIQGNHDWWSDREATRRLAGPTFVETALSKAGIRVYGNDALRLEKDGKPFWIAGLGDQIAFVEVLGWRTPKRGVDDLPGTLAKITDDAPVILMAHEPDIFPQVPDRVAITLSGHTHGGQIAPFGWRPVVPSRYGSRYAYGHIEEDGRHLIVSGGLGCSGIPVRIGSPPELVVVELGG